MATPLKEIYSPAFVRELSTVASGCLDSFDPSPLKQLVSSSAFKVLELKERGSALAEVFGAQLPKDFKKAADKLVQICQEAKRNQNVQNTFALLFIPEIIEKRGIDYPKISLAAMEKITPIITCEFAIRPFILAHEAIVLKKVSQWAEHKNEHVRRLASEGIRPRLPWAMALPAFKKNPDRVIEIIEKLKEDKSEYVRRSVANNLNDISKDHPLLVIKLVEQWKGISPETDALLKHGSRTLLKASNREMLTLFDYGTGKEVVLKEWKLFSTKINLHEAVEFEFTMHNSTKSIQKTRIEYALYFLKGNGTWFRKVFKISERYIAPGEMLQMSKKHSIKPITTRKYYPGIHHIGLVINGVESTKYAFELNL